MYDGDPWLMAEISIHAPREGCDRIGLLGHLIDDRFQSTHPVRGATAPNDTTHTVIIQFQSTHPVRGATPTTCKRSLRTCDFNPRTP